MILIVQNKKTIQKIKIFKIWEKERVICLIVSFCLSSGRFVHDKDDKDDSDNSEHWSSAQSPVPVVVEGIGQAAAHNVAKTAKTYKIICTFGIQWASELRNSHKFFQLTD